MVRNFTYQNPIHHEENTPLVTILELKIDTKQATAVDSRRASYVIELSKAAFGGTTYPEPGSQWYLKKISGVWTLMARAPRQNPQLDPALDPQPGDTYIGNGGTTVLVGDVDITGTLTGGGGGGGATELDDLTDVIITAPSNNQVLKYNGSDWVNSAVPAGTIDGLTDVIITAASDRQVLQYNGSEWVNRSTVRLVEATSGTSAIESKVTGDAQERFVVNADGKLQWGSGSGAVDTNLYRNGAGSLFTDGVLFVLGDIYSFSRVNGAGSVTVQPFGESEPRIKLNSGTTGITFSDGSAAADTNLYRGDADQLWTDDEIWVNGASSSTGAFLAQVTGDSTPRLNILSDGTHEWGSGGATRDTNLYRSAAGILKTDGHINLVSGKQVNIGGSSSVAAVASEQASAGLFFFSARVAGDSDGRIVSTAGGELRWGSGAANQDTNLYRNGVNILKTDGSLQMIAGQTIDIGASGSAASFTTKRAGATDFGFSSFVSGDTVARFTEQVDGKLLWGAGGASAVDTNLYRSAADTLKTDDALTVVGAFKVGSGPVEIDPASPTTGHHLRYNGTKFVSAAPLFDDSSDVDLSGAANGNALIRASSVWTPLPIVTVCTAATRPSSPYAGQLAFETDTLYLQMHDGSNWRKLFKQNQAAWPHSIDMTLGSVSNTGIGINITGDGFNRWLFQADGKLIWGDGTATGDTNLYRNGGSQLATDDDFLINSAGRGLRVKEGSNAKMGASTLAGGTVVVNNTSVTANSRILLTCQTPGGTPGFLRVSARTASTSFTILSSNGADTSTVAWLMLEPA